MTFTDSESFWNQARQIYWIPSTDAPSGYIVGGYYRQTELFNYLTVPKAGHFVPNPQLNYYAAAYAFFTDYLANQKLTCQKTTESACSVTNSMCGYMNNCYGLGECGINGQCTCADAPNSGLKWKGADCSLQSSRLNRLSESSFKSNPTTVYKKSTGPQWWSFYSEGLTPRQI